mgnify:CR=1 FL=1
MLSTGKIEQIFYDVPRDRYIFNGKSTYFGYYDNKDKRFYKFGESFPNNYPNLDIVKGYYQYSKAKIFSLPNDFGCDYILSDGNNKLYIANVHKINVYGPYRQYCTSDTFHAGNTSFAWTLSADRQSIIVYCDKGFIAVDTQKILAHH